VAPQISFQNAATDTTGSGATAIATVNTEVKMVDALPPTPASTLKACGSSNPISGSQLVTAILDASGNPLNGTGLPANCYPLTWPTDGRDGGVPDPTTAGPPIIEIASEGGLLPNPVVIPSTPVGYEYNRRSITVLNVWNHGLLLGPAERADVVVDFSKFAGQTLILYNDAPAPVPAFDPRSDYYTGDPDQTLAGGAPSTLPGYGPNTRTIMRIVVNGGAPSGTFSLPTLAGALPGIFATTQQTPIVPEQANNLATQSTYVPLQSNTINAWLGVPVGGVKLTKVGAGYIAAPSVNIIPALGDTTGTGASASATLKPTSVESFALGIAGSGYTSAPGVSVTGGGGAPSATATTTLAPTSVASITINDQGRGYTGTSVPVTFVPANGGIQANATIANGRITGITFVNHGGGYNFPTPPTATVPNPPCTPLGTTQCHRAVLTAVLAPTSVASINWASGGAGYTSAPLVTVAAPIGCRVNCVRATGSATLKPTSIASLTLISGGTGYTAAPTVQIGPPTCTIPPSTPTTCVPVQATAVASASTPLLDKTIQELFTLDYGRMNATLGVELPFTNFLTQTTIPYGYIDPPTEIFKDGEVQFWKITHNGVDTHFIHFHLFNVQVINRIGWDNAVKPPDPNEVGWKDTVRMNPLEIIVVALRPMQQNLPFNIPNSFRRLDVTQPAGSTLGFTNVDPTNQPAAVTNDMTNFGDEYVWHCHILGHEENDMMRAMILAVPPGAPASLTSLGGGSISWVDASTNETGFTIQVAPSVAGVPGVWGTVGTVATQGNFGPGFGSSVGTTYTFKNSAIKSGVFVRVLADNTVGYTKTYAAPAVGYPHTTASAPSAPLLIP